MYLSPRRYNINELDPSLMIVFLNAHITRPGKHNPGLRVMIRTETDLVVETETLSLTFDRAEIPSTFWSALLGGLLVVLQNTQRNVPLLVCSSSDFLSRALVKDRSRF
jgi:hypothetical protein